MPDERIAILENDNKYFREQVLSLFQILKDHMKKEEDQNDRRDIRDDKRHEETMNVIDKIEKKWEDALKDLDERKADKITQTIVFGLVGIILVGVVTALVTLVIK